jgi:hypothetical protein
MNKINNLLAWAGLLNGCQSSFQQRYLCDEIEKRFPVKLIRAYSTDRIAFVNENNTTTLLGHLVLLEEEVKV